MDKYGFVYLWYDRKHRRYYVGSHWGHIEDGYICSSKWMRNAYKYRPDDFKRRIIDRYDTKESMFIAEERFLSMIKDEELGTRYYNLCKHTFKHWSADPERKKTFRERQSAAQRKRFTENPVSEETRQKLSIAGKGKTHSQEHIERVAEANRGLKRSDEVRRAMSESRKGRKVNWKDPEARGAKIAASLRGKPLSEEHKAKLRAAKARRKAVNT